MAKLIQAYRRYCPKVKLGKPAGHEEISAYIAQSTGLDRHESRMMLGKLCDAILHYTRQGRGVKLEGILSLWPIINTKGRLSFGRRFDTRLAEELNDMRWFVAVIANEERLSWSEQDYRDTWNTEFPDDPIEP